MAPYQTTIINHLQSSAAANEANTNSDCLASHTGKKIWNKKEQN